MMQIFLGRIGLRQSQQGPFPEETMCIHCKKQARIAFVALESFDKSKPVKDQKFVCRLHENIHRKGLEGLFLGNEGWPHDCCAFATYICKECMECTTLWNQA